MTLLLWTHVMYHSPPESPVFSCPFIFHRTVAWLGVTHRSCITNLLLDLYIVQLFGHSARIICDGNLGKCSWKPTRLSRLRLCLCRNTRKPARKLLDMGGSEIGCGSQQESILSLRPHWTCQGIFFQFVQIILLQIVTNTERISIDSTNYNFVNRIVMARNF